MCTPRIVIGLNVLFLVGLRMGITGYVLSVALADLACTLFLSCASGSGGS